VSYLLDNSKVLEMMEKEGVNPLRDYLVVIFLVILTFTGVLPLLFAMIWLERKIRNYLLS